MDGFAILLVEIAGQVCFENTVDWLLVSFRYKTINSQPHTEEFHINLGPCTLVPYCPPRTQKKHSITTYKGAIIK